MAQIPVDYDADERHEQLFVQFPGEVRAARASGESMSIARLAWFQDMAILYRIQFPERWPDSPTFDDFVRDVHAFRAELEHPTAPFAVNEWNRSVDLENCGAFDDERLLMRTLLEVYPEDDPNRFRWHAALAICDREVGLWEDALGKLDELERLIGESPREIAESPEATEARFLVDAERIAIYIDLGLHEEAVRMAGLARRRAELLQHPGPWSDVVQLEMNIALAIDDHARAERVYEEALEHPLYGAIAEQERLGMRLRLALSRAERERLDPAQPRRALQTMEDVLKGKLSSVDRLIAEQWTAELLMDTGDPAGAGAALERARLELSRRRPPRVGEPPLRAEVDQIVNEARLAVMVRANDAELAEHLRETRRAFVSLIDRWAAVTAPESGLAILHTRDRMRLTESLVELLLAVHGDEDGPELALIEIGRAQQLGSLARELGADAPSLVEIRASLLPPGGGLLVLLPGAVQSYAFTIDARDVRAFELPPIYRLDPLRRSLVRAIDAALAARSATGSAANELERLTAEMASELLPADLAEVLTGWEELGVVGLDSLGYVPFEYLPLTSASAHDPGRRERLGDRLAVGYLPSLPVAAALARRWRAPVRNRVSLVAAPDAPDASGRRAGELQPLRFGPRERALLGTEVVEPPTLEVLLGTDFRGTLALQLLAHGLPTSRADRPQGLLFFTSGGDDGVLTPRLAERLRAPPVVVLTACGAWRGTRRRGDDGRAHLAGSLLLAGARTVVLAHTAVDYQEGLACTGDFFTYLTGGASPTRALRAARREARGRASDELHPVHAYLIHAVGFASATVPVTPASERGGSGFMIGWQELTIPLAVGLLLWAWVLVRTARRADGTRPNE